MIYPLHIYGSQILRNESEEITKDYPELDKLIENMWATLKNCEGVGLAAPQIGKNIRMFIVDCTPWAADNPELEGFEKVYINPEILEVSEEMSGFEEGCLSLPGIHANVNRPAAIKLRWLDENFEEHEELIEGLPARVIQHEYDHIEGKVFVDHISPLKRTMIKNKLVNLTKGKYRCSYKTK
ncbi:MAG: peptide deformylase [Rikenellaceae bacterium]